MRLWSINPAFLDKKGLVAAWREGLLAQAVLAGKTTGYKNHPQLARFKASKRPQTLMGLYLMTLWDEAMVRGYTFDMGKIEDDRGDVLLDEGFLDPQPVTVAQLNYELRLLLYKVSRREPEWTAKIVDLALGGHWEGLTNIAFTPSRGLLPEPWEKVKSEVLDFKINNPQVEKVISSINWRKETCVR